ncbi:hypothetical protein N752_00690 [Desulforamulus aquiferis]|nr:hypothetical protein [Desulforamulus aquiferis]RYD07132.1 hypothetical protein N752_00690 [Desulforamulus aquiferis]
MPLAAKLISAALPLTYLVTDVRDIALMGIDLPQVLPNILILASLTTFLLPLAICCFNRQYTKQ